jgi:VanZ family protein
MAYLAVQAAVAVAPRSRLRPAVLRAARADLVAAVAVEVARATTPARAALVASVATGTAS